MIYTIASQISDESWMEFIESLPNSSGIKEIALTTPLPHISWLVCQEMEVPKMDLLIKNIAKVSSKIKIQSGGLGLFPGDRPAITINLVRNQDVNELHSAIWIRSEEYANKIKYFCSPEFWIPHITLVQDPYPLLKVNSLIEKLVIESFKFTFQIENLGILFQENEESGVIACHKFSH
jgi:2'-5' RNA ligase